MPEVLIESFSRFQLEDGTTLNDVNVAYRTWGKLNASKDNAVVVCHSLSGDSNVDAWWTPLIGPGRALCTDQYFVVCANLLGSCYGTTGPTSINSETGQPYASSFPVPTIRDNVRLQQRLLDRLGVRQLEMVIGGSIGGMIAIEFALMEPTLKRLVAVATSGRHSAWCIGWTEAQRQAIYADPDWKGGNYSPDRPPIAGLASARMMAMLSYRTPASFSERFGREVMTSAGETFLVESYLRYQGDKLVHRFDANSYVRLTQTSNSHDVARNRGKYEDILGSVRQQTLIVGVDTDILFPLNEQQELARCIPDAELAVLRSPHGHDAFLLEGAKLNSVVQSWMGRSHSVPKPPQKEEHAHQTEQ